MQSLLRSLGAQVLAPTRADLDLRDAPAVLRWMNHAQPHAIVHLAGVVGSRAWLQANDRCISDDTDQMCDALASALEHGGVQRIVTVGSTAAYPAGAPRPLQESSLHEGDVDDGIAGYARSKRRTERVFAAIAATNCVEASCVLPCNIYGHGQRTCGERANVVGALTARFSQAVREERRTVRCWGANASREFLHVDDCAAGIVDALQRLNEGVLNIGSGACTGIGLLTTLIADASGFDGTLDWQDATSQPDALYACARRARDCLAWRPMTALKAGVAETVRLHQHGPAEAG